ncbi:MAG: ribonuclease HII [Ignavibacteria bacterium]
MKNFDNAFLSDSVKCIAGIDEAGRGPLAGPVVAATVVFSPEVSIEGVNDSKKLSAAQRDKLFDIIKQKAVAWSVGIVGHEEIDRINILQATLLAMRQSLDGLTIKPDLVLIDGNKAFPSVIQNKTIIKGDGKSFAIAAASILAKVTRDRLMLQLAGEYPQYLWHKNKGYGTKEHISAIIKYGYCPHHRKSFIKHIMTKQNEPERC